MGALRLLACAVRESALLGAALALHLLVALWGAHWRLDPDAAPELRLLVDAIELTIAETESETPVEAVAPDRPVAQMPRPDPAPYLLDTASSIPLALPPPERPADLPLPPAPQPPKLPEPNHAPDPTALPEIALPPAQTPRPAAGATARVDKPRLVTDLSRLIKHYPPEARRNGWEGTVVLDLRVAADGTLAEASIHQTSGHKVLDRAALRMIRDARFAGGPGRLLQPISFSLR